MNVFQRQVFNYLTIAGHPERPLALADLISRGLFESTADEPGAQKVLQKYLDENPRGCCADGITRARQELLPPPPPKRLTVMVELAIDVPAEMIAKCQRGSGFSEHRYIEKVKNVLHENALCSQVYYVEDGKYPGKKNIHVTDKPASGLYRTLPPRHGE